MLTPETLQALKHVLAEDRPNGRLSLREFGKMLGNAIDRRPYSKSYICKLLQGKEQISPRVDHAARVLMVSLSALNEREWIDPLPTFKGGPVAQLKAARQSGLGWQDLYTTNPDVRVFIDSLLEFIIRG